MLEKQKEPFLPLGGTWKRKHRNRRGQKLRQKAVMKKRIIQILAASALIIPLMVGTAQGQNQPSAKVTAKTASITLLPETTGTGDWQTVLANNIKTANQKDLFITAAFEVGLFTQTQVLSKLMQRATSTAVASVQVRVLVDGRPAEPGTVVYGRRLQQLSATLEGAIAGCLSLATNLDGSISIVLDPDCVVPEEIELILRTMDAASFSFVASDVPQGIHTVSVQARIDTEGSTTSGSFSATGTVGKGSVTVESVRMIKGEDVVLEVP